MGYSRKVKEEIKITCDRCGIEIAAEPDHIRSIGYFRLLKWCLPGGRSYRRTYLCKRCWDEMKKYLGDTDGDPSPAKIDGNTSDGYHTFNELYHHRAVLFSVIVKTFPELAWKSKLHSDGTMYEGMFIVGIDTPDGQASYHYAIDPYWDMFECKELYSAPFYDGHTSAQAIERIGKLIP